MKESRKFFRVVPLSFKVTLAVLAATGATFALYSPILQYSPWYRSMWLVVVAAVSFRYAKYLSGAARDLLQGIQEITASGRLKMKIVPQGHDEIGAIAMAFNELTASLQTHKEKLAARLAELEFLHETTRSLTQASSLRELLPRLLERSLQAVQAERGAIYLLRGNELFLYCHSGLDQANAPLSVERLPLARNGRLLEAKPGFPVPMSPEGIQWMDAAFGAWSMVPLQVGKELLGIIVIAEEILTGESAGVDMRFIETLAGEFSTLIHNSLLAEKVKAQERELRRMALDVITSQDAERARLSRELHDSVGQALGVVKYNLELHQNNFRSKYMGKEKQINETYQRLDNSLAMVIEAMQELRRIVDELRPSVVEDMGLADAVRWYACCLRERTGIAVEAIVDIDGEHLEMVVETAIYRIVQEACTNAIKHGQASNITIVLQGTHNYMLELRVEDNGKGFVVDEQETGGEVRSGSGVRGIRERVMLLRGEVCILSQPGQGTYLLVRVPKQPRFVGEME